MDNVAGHQSEIVLKSDRCNHPIDHRLMDGGSLTEPE
jgi:hypothetical protein